VVRPVRPGMRLTAGRLESWLPHRVAQPVDIEIASSTTFQDSAIVIPLVAGGMYTAQLRVAYGSNSTGRFKSMWSGPSGTRLDRHVLGAHDATNPEDARVVMRRRGMGTAQGMGGGITFASYWEDLDIEVGATGGTAMFRWGQLTSNATPTILRAESYVLYTRIG
jgi:hypothetical protein